MILLIDNYDSFTFNLYHFLGEVGGQCDVVRNDKLTVAESEIADTVSELTMVGGKIVYAAGDFARFDEGGVPPAMPDWSPVRSFGRYFSFCASDPNA